jgi:hypothetical protein
VEQKIASDGQPMKYIVEPNEDGVDAFMQWSERSEKYVPVRTTDGYDIVQGLRVWDYNWDTGAIDLSYLKAKEFAYSDPWFDVNTDKGGRSLMNADRVRVYSWDMKGVKA